ncbi:MAG: glutamate racemase [Patescibacteria group bacterium]|jgi:glutamate racemase
MIGIFDSGVGGLTVVREVLKQLPNQPIIYFGDTARTPYGNKGPKTIIRYSQENTDFLLSKGASVIVIGCNTASAVAVEALREKHPDVPILEVITPAVSRAVAVTKNKKIGVIGTRATIASQIYTKKIQEIDSSIKVFSAACPLFVPLVEENWLTRPETKMIARRYLTDFKNVGIDTLILGCTHYPLLKEVISAKIGKRVVLVDSAEEVVKEITNYELRITNKEGDSKFYFSDLTEQVGKISARWLGGKVDLEETNFETK